MFGARIVEDQTSWKSAALRRPHALMRTERNFEGWKIATE
jgi:hypothetical protein